MTPRVHFCLEYKAQARKSSTDSRAMSQKRCNEEFPDTGDPGQGPPLPDPRPNSGRRRRRARSSRTSSSNSLREDVGLNNYSLHWSFLSADNAAYSTPPEIRQILFKQARRAAASLGIIRRSVGVYFC